MATVQSTKPLTARTVEVMKPGDKDKSDTGENMGLKVTCGATPADLAGGMYTLFVAWLGSPANSDVFARIQLVTAVLRLGTVSGSQVISR